MAMSSFGGGVIVSAVQGHFTWIWGATILGLSWVIQLALWVRGLRLRARAVSWLTPIFYTLAASAALASPLVIPLFRGYVLACGGALLIAAVVTQRGARGIGTVLVAAAMALMVGGFTVATVSFWLGGDLVSASIAGSGAVLYGLLAAACLLRSVSAPSTTAFGWAIGALVLAASMVELGDPIDPVAVVMFAAYAGWAAIRGDFHAGVLPALIALSLAFLALMRAMAPAFNAIATMDHIAAAPPPVLVPERPWHLLFVLALVFAVCAVAVWVGLGFFEHVSWVRSLLGASSGLTLMGAATVYFFQSSWAWPIEIAAFLAGLGSVADRDPDLTVIARAVWRIQNLSKRLLKWLEAERER